MPDARRFRTLLVAALAVAVMGVACGDGGEAPRVIIEPLATPSVQRPVVPGGEKLASTQATRIAAGQSPTAQATATAAPEPTAAEPTEPTPPPSMPTSQPIAVPEPTGPPPTGRWIEVDVTNYVVRLMDGAAPLQEIAPVGVGVQIDTGEYLSTQTGLFHVNGKAADLVYDAPFDTYISHWVGFDADKDNGFHSFLKDAQGAVVDASTGRVSNGCIRTGGAEEIYAFAEIGMPVWVHW